MIDTSAVKKSKLKNQTTDPPIDDDIQDDLLIARFDDQLERALQIKHETIPGSIFGDKKPNTLFNEAAEMVQKRSLPNKLDDETFAN